MTFTGKVGVTYDLGAAVIEPNVRGSSGYGKTYLSLDNGFRREDSVRDIGALLDWIATREDLDEDRVAVFGGSYGGYMVLAALAFEPEEFTCGVDIFGVANWLLTLENIPPYWESFRLALYAEIGHPVEDAEFLRATSAVFHGDKITKPLMILQGANDPRVPKSESDAIVEALKARDIDVPYMVKENEGHGFRNEENRFDFYRAMERFLGKHLGGRIEQK